MDLPEWPDDCPICGMPCRQWRDEEGRYFIECDDCSTRSGYSQDPKANIEWWNNRPPFNKKEKQWEKK